jgi:arylsulfatase A-like enzyme
MIVYGPGLVPGGRTLKLADFSDFLPTFCELAGAPLPSGVTLDGRSFARTLLDPSASEACQRLQAVLDRLPADNEPPFPLRSQSMFRLRSGLGPGSK